MSGPRYRAEIIPITNATRDCTILHTMIQDAFFRTLLWLLINFLRSPYNQISRSQTVAHCAPRGGFDFAQFPLMIQREFVFVNKQNIRLSVQDHFAVSIERVITCLQSRAICIGLSCDILRAEVKCFASGNLVTIVNEVVITLKFH